MITNHVDVPHQEYEPFTIAAVRRYQIACGLDRWHDYKPADYALRCIAKSMFPSRGDVFEILDQTIFEYALWDSANPRGFWTAFKHDMFDSAKAADNAKTISLDDVRSNTDESAIADRRRTDQHTTDNWWREQVSEIHCAGPSVIERWDIVQVSEHPTDRLICTAARRLAADDTYMDELARSRRPTTTLARFMGEICQLANCSQPTAYRMVREFRERHSSPRPPK